MSFVALEPKIKNNTILKKVFFRNYFKTNQMFQILILPVISSFLNPESRWL